MPCWNQHNTTNTHSRQSFKWIQHWNALCYSLFAVCSLLIFFLFFIFLPLAGLFFRGNSWLRMATERQAGKKYWMHEYKSILFVFMKFHNVFTRQEFSMSRAHTECVYVFIFTLANLICSQQLKWERRSEKRAQNKNWNKIWYDAGWGSHAFCGRCCCCCSPTEASVVVVVAEHRNDTYGCRRQMLTLSPSATTIYSLCVYELSIEHCACLVGLIFRIQMEIENCITNTNTHCVCAQQKKYVYIFACCRQIMEKKKQ